MLVGTEIAGHIFSTTSDWSERYQWQEVTATDISRPIRGGAENVPCPDKCLNEEIKVLCALKFSQKIIVILLLRLWVTIDC